MTRWQREAARNKTGPPEPYARGPWIRSALSRSGTKRESTTKATFDKVVNKINLMTNRIELYEDDLSTKKPVDIMVTAHMGTSNCTSVTTVEELRTIVKLPAPQNIHASWSDRNLKLTWKGEMESASVEVQVRKLENESQPWEKKQMAYQVQVKQRTMVVVNSSWSDWSSIHTVPAEIKQTPEVHLNIIATSGTRELVLTWEAVPPMARAGGVNYTLTYPQHGCPCPDEKKKSKKQNLTIVSNTSHSVNVTNSAVNLTITAVNLAGSSSPRYVHVPAKPAKDLKACKMPDEVPKNTCMELYEIKGEDPQPHKVKRLRTKKKKNKKTIREFRNNMTDLVRYKYLEHRCVEIPQTVEMCLTYNKEGVPRAKPSSFIGGNATESSVDLSWRAIPAEDQQGFLTHYTLCYTKTNHSQNQEHHREECVNLTGSQTKFRLENLKPEARYNISLAGVTSVGPGPKAISIVDTDPPKHMASGHFVAVISLGLLISFFVASTVCSLLVKRFKSKIFPPIPKPMILPSSLCQAANQEEVERREQVDEVSVHQPMLEGKHQDLEEDVDIANTIIGTDLDQTQRGSSDSFESPDYADK
ncbi:hypothetical protein CRUP_012215 [Coryphaenoides rupestris]|nr:hypothetical protein CRUP_012215 [Coryphaenoides rupestris]